MLLRCSKCEEEKEEDYFVRCRAYLHRNGRGYLCYDCSTKAVHKWRQENPNRAIECAKKSKETYRTNNLDKIREMDRSVAAERRKDPEYRVVKAEYYQRNKDKWVEYANKQREANPDNVREHRRRWYDNNKESIFSYKRNKRKTDPIYRISCNMRSAFSLWIRGRQKTCSVMDLIGMSVEELKQWLESQFMEGMAWDNRSAWHIDHYVPQSHFDPNSQEDMKVCWHYLNLRPLWAFDNLSKNDKLPEDYEEHINKIKEFIGIL